MAALRFFMLLCVVFVLIVSSVSGESDASSTVDHVVGSDGSDDVKIQVEQLKAKIHSLGEFVFFNLILYLILFYNLIVNANCCRLDTRVCVCVVVLSLLWKFMS